MPFGSIKLNDGSEVGFRWDAMPWPLIVPARLTTRQIPAIAFGDRVYDEGPSAS